MKKLLILLVAGLLLTACGDKKADKSNASDTDNDYIGLLKSATKDINNAETMQDLENIMNDLDKKAHEMDKKLSEEERKKLEEDPEFQKALDDFNRACSAAGKRCAQNSIEDGEDPESYFEATENGEDPEQDLEELQEYM